MKKTYTPKTANDIYSSVIAEMLDHLENGTPIWRKAWNYDGYAMFLSNPLSETPFTGRNVFILAWTMMLRGYDSPYFATAKQIFARDGKVIKGSQGIRVVRFNPVKETMNDVSDRLNKPVASCDKSDKQIKFLSPKYYTVFNLKTQTEGIDDLIPETTIDTTPTPNPIEACETLWSQYADSPRLTTSPDGSAAYYPGQDFISMPPQHTFDIPEEYYSTLFHEGSHSTGHETRLNRKLGLKGSKLYAIEELVAEITAAMLCGVTGIETKTLENSSAYVKGWLERLKDDPDILFSAMVQAERSANYMQKIGEFVPKVTTS